jgi:glutathione S-transferase
MSTATHPKTTLWLWPTGLFPRRIIFYLRAKNLTLPILAAHNISLIPVALTPDFNLLSLPHYEARPPNTSLPVMRLEYEDEVVWIRESAAIIGYFEDVFSGAMGYKDLWGTTVQQRARTRDAVSLLNDVVCWGAVDMVHSNAATLSWSGMKGEEGMSASAAEHARAKVDGLLAKLDGWVKESGEEYRSLSGRGADVTVLDVVVMSLEYLREMYGEEGLGGHAVLKAWWERLRGAEWVVTREDLKKDEESGQWAGVLGQ